MRRIFSYLLLFCLVPSIVFAQGFSNGTAVNASTQPATYAVSVTSNAATQARCRAVWIGTTQNLDFSFDGSTWIEFQGATAGTIIPIQVVGARITAASANPAAGDVVFLY